MLSAFMSVVPVERVERVQAVPVSEEALSWISSDSMLVVPLSV